MSLLRPSARGADKRRAIADQFEDMATPVPPSIAALKTMDERIEADAEWAEMLKGTGLTQEEYAELELQMHDSNPIVAQKATSRLVELGLHIPAGDIALTEAMPSQG